MIVFTFRPWSFPLIVLGSFAASGCGASASFTPMNSPPRPMSARSVESVQLITTTPQQPFVEVGTIDAGHLSSWGAAAGSDALVAAARQRGAETGCDAIVVRGQEQGSETTLPQLHATCILYKDPSVSPPVAR